MYQNWPTTGPVVYTCTKRGQPQALFYTHVPEGANLRPCCIHMYKKGPSSSPVVEGAHLRPSVYTCTRMDHPQALLYIHAPEWAILRPCSIYMHQNRSTSGPVEYTCTRMGQPQALLYIHIPENRENTVMLWFIYFPCETDAQVVKHLFHAQLI